jgi:hypothetical protein
MCWCTWWLTLYQRSQGTATSRPGPQYISYRIVALFAFLEVNVYRIMTEPLKWYTGELCDGSVEACRTCPAKRAIFAAIEAARAAHVTRLPPVPC